MVNTEGLTTQLIDEFSSALDLSTLLAILSDYDLADPLQVKAAHEVLEKLQKTAREEEATGFDASASSGADILINCGEGSRGDNDSGSGKSLPGWSSSTDDTELTHNLASLDFDGSSENGKNGEGVTDSDQLDSLDQEAKESMLVEMFPGLKPFDIKWTLQKASWDVNMAINDLMNQLFLEENGTRHRGIEAFSESDFPSQFRKRKGNKKKNGALNDLSGLTTPVSPTESKWEIGKQDVEFITTRTGMSPTEIGSLYHKNGASIRATIIAVLDAQAALTIKWDNPLIESNAIDLSHEFPSLPRRLLQPLVEVTHPSTAHAHELAKALVYEPPSGKPNIQIEFRHSPIELETKASESASSSTFRSGLTLDTVTGPASKYIEERETAFAQARAAYRKGKSDHLMGGAAAYYSELGRAVDSRLKSAQSAAADALVGSQSSRTQLDLHGVSVKDGKRIARERVTTWWHELGESRIRSRGIGNEYRIVTGVGYHSEGGKSKLAPSILKMLMNDGWNVKVETGVLVVTGVAKKR